MNRRKNKPTEIPGDIKKAIEEAFPDNIVRKTVDFQASYFRNTYPILKTELSQIEDTVLSYEQDADKIFLRMNKNGVEEVEDSYALSSSYHVFFLGLIDEQFHYSCEGEIPVEDNRMQSFIGTGMIGCLLSVSLIAPYALVKLREIEQYDDGNHTCPDINHAVLSLDGKPIEMEDHYRETFGEEAVSALHETGKSITTIVHSLGITVLPEEMQKTRVPWLQAGNAMKRMEQTGKEMTVQDAFFFQEW